MCLRVSMSVSISVFLPAGMPATYEPPSLTFNCCCDFAHVRTHVLMCSRATVCVNDVKQLPTCKCVRSEACLRDLHTADTHTADTSTCVCVSACTLARA